jgi:hypothetical protein
MIYLSIGFGAVREGMLERVCCRIAWLRTTQHPALPGTAAGIRERTSGVGDIGRGELSGKWGFTWM